MIKKFECWQCNKTFEADDSNWVECPHCHSDNVEYSTFHLPKKLYKIAGIICVAIIVIAGGWLAIMNIDFSLASQEVLNGETKEEKKAKMDSDYIIDGGKLTPSIILETVEYNAETNTYNCAFRIDYPPEQAWKIVILEFRGDKIIAESDNGIFENLPYSQYDGFYTIRLADRKTGEPLVDDKEMPNFDKQVLIKNPWSKSDLESRLNSSANLTDADYVADPHTVIIKNKPKNDTTPTGSLREVQDMLKKCTLHATVVNLEYDDMNKISSVTLTINYPKDWFMDDDDDDF